jgi:hypothetical protein
MSINDFAKCKYKYNKRIKRVHYNHDILYTIAAVYNIEEHENCGIDALFQRKYEHTCPQK